MGTERPRRAEVRAFPSGRRLVTAAMRAGRRMAPMQGLVDVDVTLARLAHVLYDADVRGVPDLTAALHQVKGERAGGSAGSLSEPSRLTPMTLMTLDVVVGGMTQRPRVVEGRIEIRDVLDLCIAIDHNVADGAPATRFCAELRELIETAAVLSTPD